MLEEAEFNVRKDGRISVLLKDNQAYKQYYAKGKHNFGVIEDELRFLGKIIGLEFSPDSDFHQELIFTPACSNELIKKGLIYNAQYLENLMRSRKTTHSEHQSDVETQALVNQPADALKTPKNIHRFFIEDPNSQ